MAISSLPCIQPVRVPFKACSFFPAGVCGGFKNKKRINAVVFSSLRKISNDINIESKVDTLLDSIKWDDKGLAVAIAQNVDTGAILMQGFVNRDALATTITSRKATFFSRSRATLWTKGETSNNFINIYDIFVDCDRDSIIYLGKPDGPTCHTGSETCYFTSIGDLFKEQEVEETNLALTTLYSLEATISKRELELAGKHGKPSWTKRLLLDENLLCSKIREEADELCRTLEEKEDSSCTASEMADVIYHAMSFVDLQFPNGQLTYVSYEGLTTSAFLPLCGGLLQAQGQYPGEMRYSFSCKNKWGTRITPMVLWPDKSFALGLSQALAWKRSGLMMKPSIQFSLCPTFGGSNPGLRAEVIHTVKDNLNLICGCSLVAHPSAFASISLGRSKWNGNVGNSGIVVRVDTPLSSVGRPSFSVQINNVIEF